VSLIRAHLSRLTPFVSRKASLKAHPDKGGSEEKMAEVNRAYEVLSNDGMHSSFIPSFHHSCPLAEHKARYDAGEDPMDPTANQQGPFQQGPGFGGMPQQMFHQFFQQQAQQAGGSRQQFNFRWG
jgi:DnaJ homolog subfamily C member 3